LGFANHAFIHSTETNDNLGRWASSGQSSRMPGDGGGSTDGPHNDVPDWALYSRGYVFDSQFMDDLRPYMDQGIWFPWLNDCHSDLKNGFQQLGVPFPGVPGGRVNVDFGGMINNVREDLKIVGESLGWYTLYNSVFQK